METVYTKLYSDLSLGFSLTYYLTKTEMTVDGAPLTRYGVAVESSRGDASQVLDVFGTPDRAAELLRELHRGLVTPVTLKDVVYDRLCAATTV